MWHLNSTEDAEYTALALTTHGRSAYASTYSLKRILSLRRRLMRTSANTLAHAARRCTPHVGPYPTVRAHNGTVTYCTRPCICQCTSHVSGLHVLVDSTALDVRRRALLAWAYADAQRLMADSANRHVGERTQCS